MNRLLVLPRVYLGVIFAVAVYGKITAPAAFTTHMTGFLNQVALQDGFPWYQAFVRGVVLPHADVFATLVIAGETFVAISLLLGVATRLGAAVAILLLLNYASGKGMLPWSPASNDWADIVLSLVVMAGAAGRTLGLDAWLHARYPRIGVS